MDITETEEAYQILKSMTVGVMERRGGYMHVFSEREAAEKLGIAEVIGRVRQVIKSKKTG